MSNIKIKNTRNINDTILTKDALLFVEDLVSSFSDRLDELLDARKERQKAYTKGKKPPSEYETVKYVQKQPRTSTTPQR